jgi:hypothetical protein
VTVSITSPARRLCHDTTDGVDDQRRIVELDEVAAVLRDDELRLR